MVERGTKRKCPSCGASYYDLNKAPIRCPKCGASWVASVPVRSASLRSRMPPPVPVAAPEVEEEEEEAATEKADDFEEAEDLPADGETFGSTGEDEERD